MGDGEQAGASEEQDKKCILVPSMGGMLCDKNLLKETKNAAQGYPQCHRKAQGFHLLQRTLG